MILSHFVRDLVRRNVLLGTVLVAPVLFGVVFLSQSSAQVSDATPVAQDQTTTEIPPGAPGAPVFKTAKDQIPNFAANPTIYSVQSGNWSSATTWSAGRLPLSNDVVRVTSGTTVTYDATSDAALAAVGVEGSLKWKTDVSTRMKVGTLIVTPSGNLEVGTPSNPVPVNIQAEIIIANRPLYTTSADPNTGVKDPQQYGTGLIVLGTVTMHGAQKNPTWTRLATEPLKGATTLSLQENVSSWKVGDKIIVPDTRHLPIDIPKHFIDFKFSSQTEILTISSISSDGKQITLSQPLAYDHKGPRNPDGTMVPALTGETILPHVANMSRNVIIRSENAAGTRGHALFTHGALVNVQNAGFYDLGRTTLATLDSTDFDASGTVTHVGTNQIGRYPAHLHHLWGSRRSMPSGMSGAAIRSWLTSNGWQYEFSGNAVGALDATPRQTKWGIVVHGTHYGKVENNVMHNVAGSGLQTEDSSESYNLISHNFAARINGEGIVKVNKPSSDPDVTGDLGVDGSGFWYRGPHNWMEGNVAADATFSAHYINRYYLKEVNVPLFPGANPTTEGKTYSLLPMLSFLNQEGYGATQIGLYGAWVSGCCAAGNWPDNRISGLTVWNMYDQGVDWYHNGRATFENFIVRGDPAVTSKPDFAGREMRTRGFALDFYENVDLTLQNGDIRGMVYGIDVPRKIYELGNEPPAFFSKLKLQNYVNIRVVRPHSGSQTSFLFDTITFDTFNRPALTSTPSPLNIDMAYYFDSGAKDVGSVSDVKATDVKNYDGVVGDNFKVYFLEGGSPCTTTRPLIRGYVCGGTIATPPVVPPPAPAPSPTPTPVVSPPAPPIVPPPAPQPTPPPVLPPAPVVPPPAPIIPPPAPVVPPVTLPGATPPPVVPPPAPQPTPLPVPPSSLEFGIGSYVRTIDSLRVRDMPSLTGKQIGKQRKDRGGTIVGGPVTSGGYRWWNIDYHQGPDGWSAESWLASIDGPVLSKGTAVETTARLHVRTDPNTSADKLGVQLMGAQGVITDGPAYAGGLWWWKVDYASGADGWSTELWLTAN